MALEFTTSYLKDAVSLFRKYKELAEGAMVQVSEAQLFQTHDAESNSIAVIVKHMSGNLRSRWTDFLTTDGEKPWRDRDAEFAGVFAGAMETRESLMADWNGAWAILFGALQPLTDADLGLTVTIRGEVHSVMQAINRQLAHYPYHVGQIVWLAKHYQTGTWKPLTIPKGQSHAFNDQVRAGEASQR